MEFTTLGRTGLEVSVAGLGCGGGSRLGQSRGESKAYSIGLVRQAMDLGVNFFDTARVYGTEPIVGAAVAGVPRDSVVICSKHPVSAGGKPHSAAKIVEGLEKSLRALETDYIDVYQLHALTPDLFDHAMTVLVPALLAEKEKGKFRFLGVSESGPQDHRHEMLVRSFDDDPFDVAMLAFSMMAQNARSLVFPRTQEKRIGTLIMFAVRFLFSVPGRLQEEMKRLAAEGLVPQGLADSGDPLGFLIHEGGAENVIDAAYRFARHEPGSDVVLFGTGNAEHLETNLASILKPPLPADDVARLYELFGHLEGVGLEFPPKG